MENQDLKSGLFGSIGENMVAFELAKRNWYVYRPYFDTRIDFIAQKFVCKKCFYEWESKHQITCFSVDCTKYLKNINKNDYKKTRRCNNCGFIFDKYAEMMNCPNCNQKMHITKTTKSNQRNFIYECERCNILFNSQTRSCVKCGSNDCIEYPICKICNCEIKPIKNKCQNLNCDSEEYAVIFRTIQVKSSHKEEKGTIGFNFKVQDLIEDKRHFLIVYSRTFEDYKEKHNYWVMTVEEFKEKYYKESASTIIYQNDRLHPPAKGDITYFDEVEYNEAISELAKARKNNIISEIDRLELKIKNIDVFGKLNIKLEGDF